MKALRYLLIIVAMISVMSVSAQGLARRPEAQMRSTSTMVYSGSTLPQAATTGAVLTGSTPGAYAPAYRPGGMRKVGEDDEFENEGEDTKLPTEPNPIGDGLIPLLLLAGAYLIWRATRRRALSRSANGSQRPNHSANW